MIIKLMDGTTKDFGESIAVYEIAKSISEGIARNAVGGLVNGDLYDLRDKVTQDSEVKIVTFNQKEGQKIYWHSASHLLAHAVKRLYPDVKLGIGPAINNGFYYDFDSTEPLTSEDLDKLELEMKKIIKENHNIERFELERNEAIKFMEEKGEHYKVELIKELPECEKISFYEQGEFTDLCAGPHLRRTKDIKAVKLLSVAGAYWKGNEKNKMLTRIYGIAFPKVKELQEYLDRMEEAKKRDHRKLGRELELFTIYEEGPGFPVFLHNGIILKDLLIDYWKQVHRANDYVEVSTPIMLKKNLWQTSGHWGYYREKMYTTSIDGEDYAIKPMNCPGGMLAYKTKQHSYRDFPLRMGELGIVHRNELSGTLHGLMRVRNLTQDDAHIFMTREQVEDEIIAVMRLIDQVYQKFGFKYHVELSTRPEKSIGSKEDWELAENSLKHALKKQGLKYVLNEGDGAFYGPKIDYHLEDCIGRTWQCGTIQLDFQLPQRFELEYITSEGTKARPIMLHRVVFGSIERFIGILIEHFAGAFPFWLSPIQVRVLSISSDFKDYAQEIVEQLKRHNIRAEGDYRDERIGYKVREGGLNKIPYLFIIGKKEQENKTISVRQRGERENKEMTLLDFLKMCD